MNVKSGIIGYSGFVGSNLTAVRNYEEKFRSVNIEEIRGKNFDHLVCSGVQAVKWWANQNPNEDWQGIEKLLDPLQDVKAGRVTLISTIDVYPAPRGVDEDSSIDLAGHHAYGTHRLRVEAWFRERYPELLILRLPGLFGPGIKKNVIFDLIHNNNLDKVHPDGVFQYYDLRNLADDLDKAWDLGITLLNLSCAQIATHEIRDHFFPDKVLGGSGPSPASYDMRSKHASAWGGENGYLYTKEQILRGMKEVIEEEKRKVES